MAALAVQGKLWGAHKLLSGRKALIFKPKGNMLYKILLFSILPVITMVGGGALTVFLKPGQGFRSAVLHFASGVVISIIGVELLPGIMKQHLPFHVLGGFSAGVLLMFIIEMINKKSLSVSQTGTEEKGLSKSMLVILGIDITVDALLLGTGFAAGEEEGTLLAVALAIEVLALGLVLTNELLDGGVTRKKIFLTLISGGIFFLVIAVTGSLLFQYLQGPALEVLLSFGMAALLYLAVEELLSETSKIPEKPYMTLSFFVGFILFVMIGMYM
jgi:ZIP family zinc transporter